ncbi:MAG: hypothetical protein B7733_16085 [Myxococcales bacterium FL481]|nr:MAG: hypothetical protein B7733_16085 [Myxococcales bacterium FL481]
MARTPGMGRACTEPTSGCGHGDSAARAGPGPPSRYRIMTRIRRSGSVGCTVPVFFPRLHRSSAPGRATGLIWFSLASVVPSVAAATGPTQPNSLANPLASPEDCRSCHEFANASHLAEQARYDPYSWIASMMSNASRDPVFWAGVAVADQDVPGATDVCVRCHSPRGFLAGQGDATTMEALDPEYRDGISCDFCHRLVQDDTVPAGNGQYVIDDGEGGVLPMRGPWQYDPTGMVPSHETAFSTYLAESRMCGTCHDVTTERERVDEAGNGMGSHFNEQRTYSEWLRSDYALEGDGFASCQDCHMPAVEDVAGCLLFSELGQRHETGGRRHELVGANRFVLKVLKELYGWAGEEIIADEAFDAAIERTTEFVRSAARLEVDFPERVDLGHGIPELTVQVENLTGHKLPTGYSEGRVMWIEVVASYAGQVVYSSGRWDPEDASFADGIEDDAQVRRYEGVAEDADDGTRLHLLRNNRWVEDNRLPPKGLRAAVDTDPVGDRYQLGEGKWPHIDTVRYAFDTVEVDDATPHDGADDQLALSVRLLYLINTRSYIEFLRNENVSNASGDTVADLFEQLGGAEPIVLAEAARHVPLTGLTVAGGDDEPSDDSGSGTGAHPSTSDAMNTADTSGETESSDGGVTESSSGSAVEDVSATGSGATGEPPPGDGGSNGCSCGVDGHRSTGGWGVLPVLGVLWRRRRRRRA